MSRLVFDIETNGFLDVTDRVHCIVIYDLDAERAYSFSADTSLTGVDGTIDEGLAMLSEADTVIGHNILGFDLPALSKVYPEWDGATGEVLDTLVLSRLKYPHLRGLDFAKRATVEDYPVTGRDIGSHSLRAWGLRLKNHKDDYDGGWDHLSQDMLDYCVQDVMVNVALYRKLEDLLETAPTAVHLEHETFKIVHRQSEHGFLFDMQSAQSLYGDLVARREELRTQLIDRFGTWYESGGEFTPKVNNKKLGYTKGETVTKVKVIEFNPSSLQHIANRFKTEYGWKPTEFTPDGRPKMDESILSTLDYPEAKMIGEYLLLQKRCGQLAEGKQALMQAVSPEDGRIHGYVNTNGAVTGRMTHSKPNLAQIPGNRSPYGERFRSLMTVPEDMKLVGIDASGLELRMLAHYMGAYDNGEYAKVVAEGDVHSANQAAAGLETRDQAKTFIYAFLYGAGIPKLGSIVAPDESSAEQAKVGGALRHRFLKSLPALSYLINDVQAAAKKKDSLLGLDKRVIPVRSQHAALNTLLQGAGAVVMKQALVHLDETLRKHIGDNDYEFVANVHDEWQIECDSRFAEDIGKAGVSSIELAGRSLGLRCPLTGDYNVGTNWAETH